MSRRTQGWAVMLLGLLLLGAAVWGGVSIQAEDDDALDHGVELSGTVTRLVGKQFWDPLDNGRIEVRYDYLGKQRTSLIYLDSDLSTYQVGETVVVVVHGDKVMTDIESNDPMPLICAYFTLGGLGLTIAFWGVYRIRGARFSRSVTAVDVLTLVPLKTWRVVPRKPFVTVTPETVEVLLPAWFAARPITVPKALVVAGRLRPDEDLDDLVDQTLFTSPVVVAEFPTAASNQECDLCLAFTQPVRMPPMRLLQALGGSADVPFSWWQSRGSGAFVDAIGLRAQHVDEALAALAAAGIPTVEDVPTWLLEHRQQELDPAARERTGQRLRGEGFAELWSLGGWLLLVVATYVARATDDFRWLVPGCVGLAAGLLVARTQKRRVRRALEAAGPRS